MVNSCCALTFKPGDAGFRASFIAAYCLKETLTPAT